MTSTPSNPRMPSVVDRWKRNGQPWIGYIVATLVVLWLWQETFRGVVVHTIPYSEFKRDIAQGRIVECSVQPDEIVGTIQPTAAAAQGKTKTTAVKPPTFMFRTVRVEDPDLAKQLQAAGVKFTGVRPGFLAQFLWAWVLPIGAMYLLWRFLSRRMASFGQSIMSVGSSRARLVADKDTGVTFADVAGCDEPSRNWRRWSRT
jgi:cell division protease FtsH